MPLFRHHNNANATTAPGAGPTTATGAGTYDSRVNERVGPLGTGTGPTMNPAQPAPVGRHGNNALAGHGAYQQGMTNLPPERYNNQAGAASDPYTNTVGNNSIAPVGHLSSGQRTGKASSTTGKVERIAGTVFCNQTLKAKGIQKEQAAQAHAAQRAEISEAERLEQEASIRRQRAVDHGAHPANRALGGAAQAQEFGGNFGSIGAGGAGAVSGNGTVPAARGGAL